MNPIFLSTEDAANTGIDQSIDDSNLVFGKYPQPESFKGSHKIMTPNYTLSSYLTYHMPYSSSIALDYQVILGPTESSILSKDYISSSFAPNQDTTLLPLAVRYADQKNGIYVVERPPFKVAPDFSKVKGVNRSVSKILQDKEIWIPWTVSIIRMGSNFSQIHYSLFFNDAPLTSFDDTLITPWIPNVFGDGRTCFGDSAYLLNQRIQSGEISYDLSEIFTYMFNDFFSSWNADLAQHHNSLFTQFSNLGFLERLKDQKRIPKQIFEEYNWVRNPHKAWPIILFGLSTLSYQETMQLVSVLKQRQITANSNSFKRYSLEYKIDRLKEDASSNSFELTPQSFMGQYGSIQRSDHHSMTDTSTAYFSTVITIKFENIPEGVSLINSNKIKNPLVLAKVYSHFFKCLNDSFNYLVNHNYIDPAQYPNPESLFIYKNVAISSSAIRSLNGYISSIDNATTIDWNTL